MSVKGECHDTCGTYIIDHAIDLDKEREEHLNSIFGTTRYSELIQLAAKEGYNTHIIHQHPCPKSGHCMNCNEYIGCKGLHKRKCIYHTEFVCPTPDICFKEFSLIHKCNTNFTPVILNLEENRLKIYIRNKKTIELSFTLMLLLFLSMVLFEDWRVKSGLFVMGIRIGVFIIEILSNPLTMDKYKIAWRLFGRLPLLPFYPTG
jgi:hypothetical protein